jgi:hypothetical protein
MIMKQPTLVKPKLDITQAIDFATETPQNAADAPKNKNKERNKGKGKKTSQKASKQDSGLVPYNDVRLTANIRKDLHLKLKITAAEQRTTIGELIEKLVEKHL